MIAGTGTRDSVEEETDAAPVRHFFKAFERGDLEAIMALWAPDAINHGGLTPEAEQRMRSAGLLPSGPEGLKLVFTSLLTAFPDRKWHIEDVISDGDKIACRVTVSGTYGTVPQIPVEGGLLLKNLGVQPTGKAYSVQHVHIFRVASGKITEHWAVRDDLALLLQLGAIPGAPER